MAGQMTGRRMRFARVAPVAPPLPALLLRPGGLLWFWLPVLSARLPLALRPWLLLGLGLQRRKGLYLPGSLWPRRGGFCTAAGVLRSC